MLLTLIIFVVILSILVFVHELGHFFTARKLGVKAEEFGFGFPPRICGWKKVNGKRKFFWGNAEVESDDTIYSANWIPLGGFVKIKGENGDGKQDKDSFSAQKIWKRVAILSAGVTMNVVLCIVALALAFGIGAPQVIDPTNESAVIGVAKIQIVSLIKGGPAEIAGITLGDEVLSLDNFKFTEIVDIQKYVADNKDKEIVVGVDRLGQVMEFKVKPAVLVETSGPALGVALSKTGIVAYPWYQAIWYGIRGTYLMFIQIIVSFATIIRNAFIHAPLGVDIAGPVGIAVLTGRVARMGLSYILQFVGLLSLNLAIINFLPLPALDGGRVLFLIVEKIRGKAVNQKVEAIVHTVGFTLLMILVVIVTGKDLWNMKSFFINIWQRIF